MSLLTDSLWPGVMLWVVLYVSDYAFTLAGRGVRGRIEYTRSFMLEMSAVELFSFAGLFLVASLCTWSPFLFGGAAVCLAHGAQQRRLARKHVPGVDVGGREGGTGPQ